jgi:hypothetical protein
MGSGVKTAGYGGGSNNVMPKLSADRVTAVNSVMAEIGRIAHAVCSNRICAL